MDRFLDTNNLPKYTNNQDGDLISNRALPTKKTSVPDGFTAELSQTFKELTPIFLKLLKTIESKGILPNCFFKASLTWILKPRKDTTKKGNIPVNTHVKILNKMPANRLQQHMRKIHSFRPSGIYLWSARWFNICKSIKLIHYTNKLQNESRHDYLHRCRESIWYNILSC